MWHALGEPVPQGSMIAILPKGTTRPIVTDEKRKTLKPWRSVVTGAAFGCGPCLDGPVAVRLVFTVPRAASYPKGDLVPYRATGDLDKLTRAVLDAVVDAGLLHNDAQVADFTRLAKVYAFGHRGVDLNALPVPGVVMAAHEISAQAQGDDSFPARERRVHLRRMMAEELDKVWATWRRESLP